MIVMFGRQSGKGIEDFIVKYPLATKIIIKTVLIAVDVIFLVFVINYVVTKMLEAYGLIG